MLRNEAGQYDVATEANEFPWPPPEDGEVLGAFGQTWKSATLGATAFFGRMPRRGGTGAAILYYLVIGILVAGASLFWDMTGHFTAGLGDERLASELGFGSIEPIVAFLLSPLFLLGALGLAAGAIHLLLRLFGEGRHGFQTTVRVCCYAYSPMIFGVVPRLGAVVGTIWMLVLAVIGLREAHGAEGWKAAMAVILPFVLLVVATIFAALVLVAALLS